MPYISDELKKYDQCDIFKEDFRMESISIEGAVVVNMTGEEIILSENKVKHLRRVPKYFFLMQKGIHLLPDGVPPSEAQVGLHG